jgi:integrase
VCVDQAGRALPAHQLNDGLDRVALVAGVGPVHPHLLRHSAASLLIAEGTPITDVAAMLGHANPNVTLSVYSHALKAGVEHATSVLSTAMGEW